MSGAMENASTWLNWNHSTLEPFQQLERRGKMEVVEEEEEEEEDGRYGFFSMVVILVVLGVIILATVVGNIFVMAAVVLERNLHNVANYLTASLAAADLLVAVLVMPLAAVQEVSSGWYLGRELCDMWTSFDLVCCTASILHLVAISVDRYWAVTRVDYIHRRSGRRMVAMIGASWGLAVVISVPPLFLQRDPDETGACVISQDPGYTIFSTVGAFYLPFLFMMGIYLRVFRAARSSIRRKRFKEYVMRENPGGPGGPGGGSPLTTGGEIPAAPVETVTTPASQDNSSIDEMERDDDNPSRNGRYLTVVTPTSSCINPPSSPSLLGTVDPVRASWTDLGKPDASPRRPEASPRTKERRAREKIEQRRERKAARTLAIVTGSFIVCWLPFFIIAVLRPFCLDRCNFPPVLLSVILWLGYFNSLLNPVIYTIFNPDFRLAFRKILFGKYRRTKYRRAVPILTDH